MKHFLFVASICLLFLSCKKTDNEPTKDDTYILQCKVNGGAHTYKGKPTYLNDDGVVINKRILVDSTIGFEIIADNSVYDDFLLLFIKTDPSINSGLPLINTPYKLPIILPFTKSFYNKGGYDYIVDTTSNSTIVFTRFDEEVAAGTFEFHGVSKDNIPIAITEGFFDISRK